MHQIQDNSYAKQEYEKSTNMSVRKFVQEVLCGAESQKSVTVGFFSERAASVIENLTGKSVIDSRIVLDTNAVWHIINRHGANGSHDQSMKNIEDIARMGYILEHYDQIKYKGITTTGYLDENGKPAPMIQISKKINGSYYVICAVNSSKRKRTYIVTAYMSKKKEQ